MVELNIFKMHVSESFRGLGYGQLNLVGSQSVIIHLTRIILCFFQKDLHIYLGQNRINNDGLKLFSCCTK
jgi:hypothetical protein